LVKKRLVTLGLGAIVDVRGIVASESSSCLRQGGLIGPRVNREQRLALGYEFSLCEMDPLNLAPDLGLTETVETDSTFPTAVDFHRHRLLGDLTDGY